MHVVDIDARWQRASASLKFRTRKPFAKCRVLVNNVLMQKIRSPRHDCIYGLWLRLILLFVFVLLGLRGVMLRADQIVYDDTLENDWQDWSWNNTNYNYSGTSVHTGFQILQCHNHQCNGVLYHCGTARRIPALTRTSRFGLTGAQMADSNCKSMRK